MITKNGLYLNLSEIKQPSRKEIISDSILNLQTYEKLSYEYAEIVAKKYLKLATQLKRLERGKLKTIEFSAKSNEIVKEILLHLLEKTSDDLDEFIDVVHLLTGWSHDDVMKILVRLEVENFIELLRTVRPYTIVKRF